MSQNSLGDLVVGTEDAKVRIFTRDPSREEHGEELKEYEQEMKARTNNADSEDFKNAPDWSQASANPGKKEGEIKVFKKQGVPGAYMWKMSESKWDYVGEVVSNPNQGGGNMGMVEKPKHYPGDAMFEEGEYDHVFDVELGDNVMRKLPFNNGGNAITAAEKFCARESLGRANIEQIRTFISTHAQPFVTRKPEPSKSLVQPNEPDNCMRFHLLYEACKIDGPFKKILEFNEAA